MRNTVTLLILPALVLLFVFLLPTTEGLECYQCIHIDKLPKQYDGQFGFHSSCKNGKIPESHLVNRTCGDMQYINETEGLNETISPVCLKAYSQTALRRDGKDEKIKITYRGCVYLNPNFTQSGCEKGNLENAKAMFIGMDDFLDFAIDYFAPNVPEGDVCVCDSNNCNAANSMTVHHVYFMSILSTLIYLTLRNKC